MSEIRWQKSSFSTDGNECIELSRSPRGIFIREGDSPNHFVTTSPTRLKVFMSGIRSGKLPLTCRG
ncbi:DUF397 domain-containing protein [Streptomyces gamaensis]|uniref:DUF397 domain-containing protein n=1 Tax=Streptomyces gamaensis TaxID=1763542 RepID=A0ABW0YXQ2_9ACTN